MEVREQIGEIIEVYPQDGEWYIHGHVPYEEAVRIVKDYWEDYLWEDGLDGPFLASHAWHRYYRWGDAEKYDIFIDDDHPFVFLRAPKGSSKAFPVTEIWENHVWKEHEEIRAVRHWLRFQTLHRWPDAEILSISALPWKRLTESTIRFRLPNRTGRDEHVWKALDTHVFLGAQESWRAPICARLDRFYKRNN